MRAIVVVLCAAVLLRLSAEAAAQSAESATPLVANIGVDGMAGDAMSQPVTVRWSIAQGMPSRLPADTKKSERRWVNDDRLDFIIISAPSTIRVEGRGFLIVAPGQPLPFGLPIDTSKMRIVFPLYLPESLDKGAVVIKRYRAGAFRLTVRHITATSKGVIRENTILFDQTATLVDREPVLIVQDRLSSIAAAGSLSADGQYVLQDYGSNFSVFNAETNGLIFSAAGKVPRFSRSGRFVHYTIGAPIGQISISTHVLADLLSRREAVVAWTSSAAHLSTGDQYMYSVGLSWGDFQMDQPLGGWSLYGNQSWGAHCCGGDPSSMRVNLEDALLVDIAWTATSAEFYSLLSLNKWNAAAPSKHPTSMDWISADKVAARTLDPSENVAASSPSRGMVATRAINWAPRPRRPHSRFRERLSGFGVNLVPPTLGRQPQEGSFDTLKGYDSYGSEMPDLPDNTFGPARLPPGPNDAGCYRDPGPEHCYSLMDLTISEFPFHDKRLFLIATTHEGSGGGSASWLIQHACIVFFSGRKFHSGNKCFEISKSDLFDGGRGSYYIVALQGFLFDERLLAVAGAQSARVVLFDLKSGQKVGVFRDVPEADNIEDLSLSKDSRFLVQRNRDGKLFFHRMRDQRLVLHGAYVDDEVVLYTRSGFYDATSEGAHFAYRFFTGLGEHHAFNQFKSAYYRPNIVREFLAGGDPSEPNVEVVPPPTTAFTLASGPAGATSYALDVQVQSFGDLSRLRLYVDGALSENRLAQGRTLRTKLPIELAPGVRWITVVAYNKLGFASIPKSLSVLVPPERAMKKKGRLFYLGVAIDGNGIEHSKDDVRLIEKTLNAKFGGQYASLTSKLLLDRDATTTAVRSWVESFASSTTPEDTLVVSFAGHGGQGSDGQYYLLTSGADPKNLPGAAMRWDAIAESLGRSKGRVLVFLDACRAGLASKSDVIPNDAFAEALQRKGKAGMVIFAASKGREVSFEDAKIGHGLFSYALSLALGRDRRLADRDGSGVVELDELYGFVKRWVDNTSQSNQTPWLARDELVGQVPVL